MKRLNIIIWNFEYKIERRKRCNAKIDGLRKLVIVEILLRGVKSVLI